MKSGKALIYLTSPLLGLGLKVQFESWGFPLVELVDNAMQALASVKQQLPALIILDTTIQEAELDCFGLARLLQEVSDSLPVIFFDKSTEEFLQQGEELNTFVPYPHTWNTTTAPQEDILLVVAEAEQPVQARMAALQESQDLLQSVMAAVPVRVAVLKAVRNASGVWS